MLGSPVSVVTLGPQSVAAEAGVVVPRGRGLWVTEALLLLSSPLLQATKPTTAKASRTNRNARGLAILNNYRSGPCYGQRNGYGICCRVRAFYSLTPPSGVPVASEAAMDNRPIGMFDSGVGGLSVWRAVRKLLPEESMDFLADSGHVPYGEKT